MYCIKLCFFIALIRTIDGSVIQSSTYSCIENNLQIEYSLSYSSHSARNLTSDCALSKCNNPNNTCRSSDTPCFNYRNVNNERFCAPASICSILEPCNNITGECSSKTSVCIVNSCCSTKSVCLPLVWANLCSSKGILTIVTMIHFSTKVFCFSRDRFKLFFTDGFLCN